MTFLKEQMREVIDSPWWGLLLKVVLSFVALISPVAMATVIYIYSTLHKHSNLMENFAEWRRGHQEYTDISNKRLTSVEQLIQERSIETAVMKDRMPQIYQMSTEASVKLNVLSDQVARAQRDISDIQSKIEQLNRKNQ